MLLSDLSGKSVCILGYGKEGRAMHGAIEKYAPGCSVTIADVKDNIDTNYQLQTINYKLSTTNYQLGPRWLENLEKFDVIITSPGIPPNAKLNAPPYALRASAGKHSSKLTNATQIFLDEARSRGATVIGVTGSKGKSTTSSLIYHCLNANSQLLKAKSFLLGNIGEPAIAHIQEICLNTACGEPQRTIVVLEMSSYQLLHCTSSPPIAVITSFFPEHLDYHGSIDNYREAKTNIARFQGKGNRTYYNAKFPECKAMAESGKGQWIGLTDADAPVQISETKLLGAHNLGNIALAYRVCRDSGVPEDIAIAAIQSFTPLPHRLQSLGIHHNAEWIDDAISTTPESTIAALDALGDRVQIILLGGQDRGLDFTALGKRIAASKIHTAILFPGSGPRIRRAIEDAKATVQCIDVQSMEKAIHKSFEETKKRRNEETKFAPIILLSPSSPSYGMYKNFEEKGDTFKACIEAHISSTKTS